MICNYMDEKGSTAMLTSLQSATVVPLVNLRITERERMPPEDPPLVLKPTAKVTKSPKEGFQCPHKKDFCPPKFQENMLLSRSKI